jgi:hypothetical protein
MAAMKGKSKLDSQKQESTYKQKRAAKTELEE